MQLSAFGYPSSPSLRRRYLWALMCHQAKRVDEVADMESFWRHAYKDNIHWIVISWISNTVQTEYRVAS